MIKAKQHILAQKALMILAVTMTITMLWACTATAQALTVSYLYNLSDFNGPLPYNFSRVFIDDRNMEAYVIDGESVRVFNASGMEIYRFDYDTSKGIVLDLTVDDAGRILLLTSLQGEFTITVCNYRGDVEGTIVLHGLPEDLKGFVPNRLFLHNGELHLVSLTGLQLVVADPAGRFIRGLDLANLLQLTDKEREDAEIGSMFIDRSGTMLLTLPVKGLVYRIATDGTVAGFGKRGSAPGRFGVPSGIVADRNGNIFVSDRLRCVIMAFDSNFKFITEFGFRGLRPGNLIGPDEMAIDTTGHIYVTQLRKRGVSVFETRHTAL